MTEELSRARLVLRRPAPARSRHAADTRAPVVEEREPARVRSVLQLQQKAGNRAVSAMLQRPLTAQRWQALGEEYYHSPAQDQQGAGAIAGVPEPGQGQTITKSMAVFEATESEWRAALGDSGEQSAISLYAFLRAAMLDDAAWLEHVRRNYDGIPPQAELTREVGTGFATAERRIRRPSDEAQLALAKAMYLRGRTSLGFDLDRFAGLEVLMQAFLVRMQPRLLERMSEAGSRFGPESLGPLTHATSDEQQVAMIGSAAGTLARAGTTFAAWDRVKRAAQPRSAAEGRAEQGKMNALREADMGGDILRGVADVAAAIRAEEVERYKGLIGIALAAIPLPSVAEFITQEVLQIAEGVMRTALEEILAEAGDVLAADTFKAGLAGALAREDHTERIEDIRTEIVWAIRQFRLGDEEDDFVNTVNAKLVGAGH